MPAIAAALPRSAPETQGVSSIALLRLIDAMEAHALELHSIMVLRHGHVIAEGWWDPYNAETPHTLYSLTKSFTGTAIGMAIAEGRLSRDDQVLSFFAAEAPKNPEEHVRAMLVRHLLTMSSGKATRSVAYDYLHSCFPNPPGAKFHYSNTITDMLAEILRRVTGDSVLDYLQPRLFDPIGIRGATWDDSSADYHTGASGLRLKTEDIARFGLVYIQKGKWGDEQILPENWVEAATTFQIATGPSTGERNLGYGYQFWCGRHGSCWGGGSFGQRCILLSKQQCVIVMTAGAEDNQLQFDLLWHHLLSALGPMPLAEDLESENALRNRLASLKLTIPDGAATSPCLKRISCQTYSLQKNWRGYEKIKFEFVADYRRITIQSGMGEHRLACRLNGRWQQNQTRLLDKRHESVAVTGTWTAADTFTFQLRSIETPYCQTIHCRFGQDRLRLIIRHNVSFRTDTEPDILGRAAAATA